MPDDLRDFPLPEMRLVAADERDGATFVLDATFTGMPVEPRREPRFDRGPVIVGFDDAVSGADAAERPPVMPSRRTATWGIAGSLGVHLLPLLLLVSWPVLTPPAEQPIPVTLVLEPPPPPPAPPPKPPPHGRLASIDIGDIDAKAAAPADAVEPVAEPPAAPEPPALAPAARRQPAPRHDLVSALPKPPAAAQPDLKMAEPPSPAAQPETAPPPPPAKPAVKHAAATAPHPHLPHRGRIPGPEATQDEYLAYANALIRRYQEMIPHSLLQGRTGIAVISILVRSDGTIGRIAIKQSSGFPEIDRRAEQMVAAVGRFPPLPVWFGGSEVTLNYHMLFGDHMVLP